MIVANRKRIPEIVEMIADHNHVLLLGCGTCVTVCLAGGEREVNIMGSALRMALRLRGRGGVIIDECTIERQCEDAFIDLIAPRVAAYDAICSFGCGAGVQMLSARFAKTPVYPALNTQFIGVLESPGVWSEMCSGCGNCRLAQYAGVCPLTRCAKRVLNGPCGGSQDGKCEVDRNRDCAWQLIYDRCRALGTVDRLLRSIAPPQDWSTGLDASPRLVIREDQCIEPPVSRK
jgi:ferredoxin